MSRPPSLLRPPTESVQKPGFEQREGGETHLRRWVCSLHLRIHCSPPPGTCTHPYPAGSCLRCAGTRPGSFARTAGQTNILLDFLFLCHKTTKDCPRHHPLSTTTRWSRGFSPLLRGWFCTPALTPGRTGLWFQGRSSVLWTLEEKRYSFRGGIQSRRSGSDVWENLHPAFPTGRPTRVTMKRTLVEAMLADPEWQSGVCWGQLWRCEERKVKDLIFSTGHQEFVERAFRRQKQFAATAEHIWRVEHCFMLFFKHCLLLTLELRGFSESWNW